jgi:hypothetical protein
MASLLDPLSVLLGGKDDSNKHKDDLAILFITVQQNNQLWVVKNYLLGMSVRARAANTSPHCPSNLICIRLSPLETKGYT